MRTQQLERRCALEDHRPRVRHPRGGGGGGGGAPRDGLARAASERHVERRQQVDQRTKHVGGSVRAERRRVDGGRVSKRLVGRAAPIHGARRRRRTRAAAAAASFAEVGQQLGGALRMRRPIERARERLVAAVGVCIVVVELRLPDQVGSYDEGVEGQEEVAEVEPERRTLFGQRAAEGSVEQGGDAAADEEEHGGEVGCTLLSLQQRVDEGQQLPAFL